jgi:hypothetical protein
MYEEQEASGIRMRLRLGDRIPVGLEGEGHGGWERKEGRGKQGALKEGRGKD